MDLYPHQPLAPIEQARPRAVGKGCARCPRGGFEVSCLSPEIGGKGGTLFIGERPGATEDRSGVPFSGPSGKYLREVVAREFSEPVAFDNAVRCGTKDVTPRQIESCLPYLAATLEACAPRRVVCLGGVAASAVLGRDLPVLSLRGAIAWLYRSKVPVYLMVNPAAATRNRFVRRRFEQDLAGIAKSSPRWTPPWEAQATIVDRASAAECETLVRARGGFAFDCETYASVHAADFRLLCVSVAPFGEDRAFVWDARALAGEERETLRALLADPAVAKCGHNLKFDTLAVERGLDCRAQNVQVDTYLLRKLLDSDADGRLEVMAELVAMGGLKEESAAALAALRDGARKVARSTTPGQIGLDGADTSDALDESRAFAMLPTEILHRRNALDALATARLREELAPRVSRHPRLGHIWRSVLADATRAFVEVERWGVQVDREALLDADVRLALEVDQAERKLRAYGDVNFASPKQVADLLFGRLGLKPKEVTEKGQPSTSQDALAGLVGVHPIVADLLAYREATHFRKTYGAGLDGEGGLLAHVRRDGRIHPVYNIAGARTGRLSCENPNLHNIPRVDEEDDSPGRRVRDAFVAPPGRLLLSADYSQLELRVAALLSGDEKMKGIFRSGADFHQRTAEMVSRVAWSIAPEAVTKKHRTDAKAVNFGVMYGKTPRTFAEEWKISESAAQRIYDAILGQFSTYREWTRDCLARARRTGCVWTWWDGSLARRRFLHALDDPDSLVRSRAEHGSWNTPIQGTASEFCTRSVVECVRWIAEGDIPARVVLTVHDQIVLEVDEEILDEAAFTVRGIMQGWNSGDVPLVVDVDVGRSWGSLKRYKEERSDEGSREGEVARP